MEFHIDDVTACNKCGVLIWKKILQITQVCPGCGIDQK